ncbi:hypothetical protein AAG906_015971 [Vitis piasezkii]
MSVLSNMSSHSLAQNYKPEVKRPMVNFHPGIRGNPFINYTPDDEITRAYNQKQVEDLKDEVRREQLAAAGKPSQQLNFLDAIQRLGVAYHFEEEIEEALRHICDDHHYSDDKYDDLFRESLIGDVQGMLGLYEAAHLRVQEEDILDEALAFTTTHLKSLVKHLDHPLAVQVTQALHRPIRKGLERLEARPYISIYQDEASHSKALLKLAKLDFNLLQSLYKKELSHITRFRFLFEVTFVRDRVVETYLWIVVACFEPQYSYARRIQTKLLVLITVIDDIYDAYGTLEELELFTEAIERWDNNGIDKLPEYMKPCYLAVLDAYKEIEEKENEERSYCVHYAKEAMKNSVRAYFNEAKWLHGEYVPTVEEYMGVALVSCDVPMFTIISFVGMGFIATKEAFDWVLNGPKIVRACSTIIRLMDDMASHKFEQERGHIASSVECYMKQYSVSEQHAYHELNKQVEKAWKDINQEFLRPTAIPMPLLTRVLNFARTGDFMYKGREDIFTNVGEVIKDNVASLFIDPVPI